MDAHRHTILVVEDDDALRQMIRIVLADEGHRAVLAADGAAALDYLATARPCLVLLDLMMPGLTGQEVARQMQEHGIDVPVLVVSAARTGEQIAVEIDADGYLGKPFDIEQLVEVMQPFLTCDARTPSA